MASKLRKLLIHSKEIEPTESCDTLTKWSGDHAANEKMLYFTFRKAYG